jgi:ATP-dependent DNA helicase RecG
LLDNPCTQHHFEEITPENLRPFSKNPTLCKFMIQLGRFDELGSGVTNIHKYLPRYTPGATPRFKETTHGFELTIPLQVETDTPEDAVQVTPQVTPQVDHLPKVIQGEMSRVQIMKTRKLKDREHFREHYLQRAIKAGFVEPTIPDKPNSRLQKYRLTAKGEEILNRLKP